MKIFFCQCGKNVFFENTHCSSCGKKLGFDAASSRMLSLDPFNSAVDHSNIWQDSEGKRYHLCQNYSEYNVCNWLIPADSHYIYCLSCRLNQTIPSLSAPQNREWWAQLELAKRYLVYGLLRLNLPVLPRNEYPNEGLAFAFLEDKRTNQQVDEELVLTGHEEGLITVNIIEADTLNRERQRVSLGESYRTLLGHFRHESGHYYFERLVGGGDYLNEFRRLFGDERLDYQQALKRYYDQPKSLEYGSGFITAYAQSHPIEDWAECWAHYLHIHDMLETAISYGLLDARLLQQNYHEQIEQWMRFSLALNGLNRSLGLSDPYPFVLTPKVIEKLGFIDRVSGSHV